MLWLAVLAMVQHRHRYCRVWIYCAATSILHNFVPLFLILFVQDWCLHKLWLAQQQTRRETKISDSATEFSSNKTQTPFDVLDNFNGVLYIVQYTNENTLFTHRPMVPHRDYDSWLLMKKISVLIPHFPIFPSSVLWLHF